MLRCPYCDKDTSVPDESREPDVAHEAQCENCEMVFVFYVEYYPSYSEHKAPCLNGEDHGWKPIVGLPAEYYENMRRCEYCGAETRIEEKQDA